MLDTGKWEGLVGMILGGLPFIDLSAEGSFESNIDELVRTVISLMGGPPIKELIENIKWAEIILAPSLDVVVAASSTSSTQIFDKWLSFFNDLQIPPPVAERYSKLIRDVEVGVKIKRFSFDKIFVNYPSISLLMGL